MNTLRLGIALIWLLSLLAGRGAGWTGMPSPNSAISAEITAQPVSSSGEVTGAPSVESADPPDSHVDFLGNEIDDAIADYRIDRGGGVYESHSPETAVPKLGSPST